MSGKTDLFTLSAGGMFIQILLTMVVALYSIQGNVIGTDPLYGLHAWQNWDQPMKAQLFTTYKVDTGLCGAQGMGNQTCTKSDGITQAFSSTVYDVVTSMLNIGGYLIQAMYFFGMALFIEVVIRQILIAHLTDPILIDLASIFMWTVQIIVLYNLLKFVFKDRLPW